MYLVAFVQVYVDNSMNTVDQLLIKVVGQTVQLWERDGRSDERTDEQTHTAKYIISLTSRWITISKVRV